MPGLDFANHRVSPGPQCWWEVVVPERQQPAEGEPIWVFRPRQARVAAVSGPLTPSHVWCVHLVTARVVAVARLYGCCTPSQILYGG